MRVKSDPRASRRERTRSHRGPRRRGWDEHGGGEDRRRQDHGDEQERGDRLERDAVADGPGFAYEGAGTAPRWRRSRRAATGVHAHGVPPGYVGSLLSPCSIRCAPCARESDASSSCPCSSEHDPRPRSPARARRRGATTVAPGHRGPRSDRPAAPRVPGGATRRGRTGGGDRRAAARHPGHARRGRRRPGRTGGSLDVPVLTWIGPVPAKASGGGLLVMLASSLAGVSPGSRRARSSRSTSCIPGRGPRVSGFGSKGGSRREVVMMSISTRCAAPRRPGCADLRGSAGGGVHGSRVPAAVDGMTVQTPSGAVVLRPGWPPPPRRPANAPSISASRSRA